LRKKFILSQQELAEACVAWVVRKEAIELDWSGKEELSLEDV
jgi:hypothetical protein